MSAVKKTISTSGARPKNAKPSLSVNHEEAKKQAEILSYRAELLGVLLHHKVYPKTAAQIDDIQAGLNSLRTHVKGSLKKNELQKLDWQKSQKSGFSSGFLSGLALGFVLAALLFSFLNRGITDDSLSTSSRAFDTPSPRR